jgi:single-strand DNA-binding protein
MNNCTFIGRFATDPVLTQTPNGIKVCNFVIAVPRPWNAKKTDFFKAVVWRNNATFINKYFHKGDQIGVSGYMTTEIYEKDGNRQVALRLVVDDIHPIWKKKATAEQMKNIKEELVETHPTEAKPEPDESSNDNVIQGDDLSVILGIIPEYDIYKNPESIDILEICFDSTRCFLVHSFIFSISDIC